GRETVRRPTRQRGDSSVALPPGAYCGGGGADRSGLCAAHPTRPECGPDAGSSANPHGRCGTGGC
ncbi:MAG: hypothetical protein AVDCRST_MAG77-2401, partial [uncultured Chloroflexi bacterium]